MEVFAGLFLIVVLVWVIVPSRTEINEAMERKDRAREAREARAKRETKR